MSDKEILEWLRLLHPDMRRTKAIVENLLYHASGDVMSGEDVIICRRALVLISEAQ